MKDRPERALPRDPDLEVDEDASGMPLPLHLTPSAIGLVFVGGTVGVLAREILNRLGPAGPASPLITTFLINTLGALALGVLLETLAMRGADVGARRTLRLLLGTGLLGGFTTYSALAVHTEELLRLGHPAVALAYAGGTVGIGLLASLGGLAATRKVLTR